MTRFKLIGYDTSKDHTNEIVKSITGNDVLSIQSFLDEGLPDADLIVISGILRGTGLVYKECVKQNRNFLFVDHAYFNKGYEDPNWMRISRNRHVFGPKLVGHNSDRYDKFFKKKYPILDWHGGTGDYILLMPPTHAMGWISEQPNWEQDAVNVIRTVTDRPIKIRVKPENPIVDDAGNLVRMERNTTKDVPLLDDLPGARAVFVFNSNAAIEALRVGVPVICSDWCAAFPIAHTLDQVDLEGLLPEPDRQQLFNDLSYAQFTQQEMRDGLPLKSAELIKGLR